MALDPKKLQEAKRLLADLEKAYKTIGDTNPFKNVEAANADINELKEGLKEAKIAADDTASSLSSIVGSITDSVNELSKQNKYLNQSRSTSNQIAKSAQDALAVRRGETSINEKSVKQAKDRLAAQKRILKNSQLNLGVFSEEGMEIKSIIDKLQEYEKGLDDVLKTNEEINKQLGFAPQAAAGLDKALQKAGIPSLGIASALDDVRKNGQLAAAQGEKIGKGFKPGVEFTKGIGSNLKNAFSTTNILQGGVVLLIKVLTQADQETGNLAKKMNLTYSEANNVREELTSISNNSGDAALNTSRLQESLIATGQALGTNAKLNEKDLKTMTKLVHQAGFQHDELMNIQKLSLTNGKTLEDNTKEILGGAKAYASRNGIVVNEKEVLKEVNKSSKALQLSLGQNTKALAESVVKAKQFGLNLEQAESIASSMLDFESSIENELSAELLTGKNLNMEKARQLALEGDIAGAAAEVAKQVGGTAEFSKMNVIQQEALAKSMGLQREELASSLIEREALQKIGAKDAEEARKKYDALVQQYGVEEAQKRLGDETLATQFQQQSVQERMGDLTSKLQEIFIAMAPALLTIGDLLMNVFTIVGYIVKPIQWIFDAFNWIGESINKIIGGSKTMAYVFKGLVIGAGLLAAYMAWASLSAIPVVGAVLGGVVAGSIIAASFSAAGKIKANDMLSPGDGSSGYGKRTLFGPEGAIQLNNKDTVIAGTNLFGDDVKSEPGKPTERAGKGEIKVKSEGGGKVDMTQTNALLQQLINVIQSGGTVTLDGQKVGEALKLGSFQTQ